jgi:lipoate---protein ligase
MNFLDLTLPTLAENLALDEALLLEAEAGNGGEVLRLWEWPSLAVVVGAGGKLAEDVNLANCEADNVPVMRRSSGGGTVLLGRGCLCFSLVLAYDRSPALREIPFSYVYILDRIANTVRDLLPDIGHAGTSDLASDGKKFSGNSQQRKRNHLLHHGTLLHDFDIGIVSRYLTLPARQPEYRHQREHAAFLCNLPTSADELKRRLQQEWQAAEPHRSVPRSAVQHLMEEKYSKVDWLHRR